jgi:hypothetical protein
MRYVPVLKVVKIGYEIQIQIQIQVGLTSRMEPHPYLSVGWEAHSNHMEL